MSKTKKYKPAKLDVIKANRKGSRDAEIENSTGFTSTHKVHKSKKAYKRIKQFDID